MSQMSQRNSVVSFEVAVSFRFACKMSCFAKSETYETEFRMLKPVSRNTKFRETRSIFFREIRNSFRMKFSRISYERNSSVNPRRNRWCYNSQEKTNLTQTPIANMLQRHQQAGAIRFKEKVS